MWDARLRLYWTVALAVILLIPACATEYTASGSTVMLSGSRPIHGKSPESVTLFIDAPERKFTVVAMVSASIRLDDFSEVSEAEALALERLRDEAASAGADGVIDIQREVMDRGAVVFSSSWKHESEWTDRDDLYRTGRKDRTKMATLDRAYSLVFRGKAIKLEN